MIFRAAFCDGLSAGCVHRVSWPLVFLKSWLFVLLFCPCGWHCHCLSVAADIVASVSGLGCWFKTGVFCRLGWCLGSCLGLLLAALFDAFPVLEEHMGSRRNRSLFLTLSASFCQKNWVGCQSNILVVGGSVFDFFVFFFLSTRASLVLCPPVPTPQVRWWAGHPMALRPQCHCWEEQLFRLYFSYLKRDLSPWEISHSTLSLGIACLTNCPLSTFSKELIWFYNKLFQFKFDASGKINVMTAENICALLIKLPVDSVSYITY